MNIQIKPAPVRKTVRVNASQRHAFEFFTAKMIRWWRPEHHVGKSPLKDVVLEPRVGGRWYEVCEDASICEWGKVLEWEPHGRVLLAWQLNQDWKYDPDFITELEVRFVAEEDKLTRVELEHRNLERFGAKVDAVRASLDSKEGWGDALVAYAAAASRAAA